MYSCFFPNRIQVGEGSFADLAQTLQNLGSQKPLVVMDKFLASPQIGLDKKIDEILGKVGMKACFYSGIAAEPTSDNVDEALKVAKSEKVDAVIALGGGSAMDVAKAAAVLVVNPDLPFADIVKQATLKRLPLVAIPTTSGTGSECTKVSVITNAKTGIKENPGHPGMLPDIAILDPQLSVSLPADLTAFTGMDALTHAVEAYVSNKSNPISDLFANQAISLVGQWLEKAVQDGSNMEAREQMALASTLAGVAFSNASTNLAHAGGRALGAYFHIPHGLSVALLLPAVMEFGLDVAEEKYAKTALALGANPHKSQAELAKEAIQRVEEFNTKLGIYTGAKNKYLADLAAYRKAIPEMVKNSLAGNGILTNPKVPDEKDVTLVFEKLAARLEAL